MARSGGTPFPWLSGLLLAACLVFSIHARIEHQKVSSRALEALDEARAFFLAHPYLEPAPLLEERIGAAEVERARTDHENRRRVAGRVRTPSGTARRQQAALDALVESALAGAGALPARRVAAVPAEGLSAAWLAHALLHPSQWRLVGTGVLLLRLGLYPEAALGRAVYAGAGAAAALAGAGAWTLAAPDQAAWGLVGTTPLLAGLLGAFALHHAARASEPFYGSVLVAGGLWLALPPYAGALWSFAPVDLVVAAPPPAAPALAWAALGAAGVGLAVAVAAWLVGLDGERVAGEASPSLRDPRFRRAVRARAAGRPREALEQLDELLREQPDALEAALAAWEIERELGRAAEAAAALVRVVRIELKRGLAAPAVDHWLDLVAEGIPKKADPTLLIHMASLLREVGHRASAVHALRCALERSDDRASHVVAARIARAARGLDPEITEAAAWRALGSIELSLKERQAIEALLGELFASGRARSGVAAPSHAAPEAPPPAAPARSSEPSAREIEVEFRERALDAVTAVPLELADAGLEIQTSDGVKKLVRYARIEAVAVAAVHGLAPKPVIVVDLALNWRRPASEPLRVIRLRGDQFDPRQVLQGHDSAVDALRSVVVLLLEHSRAAALPDANAAVGRPFVSYDDLATYHRAVLLADLPPAD